MNEIKTLQTWSGYAEFKYSGSVAGGTTIPIYGYQRVLISASHYESLLDHFRGCTVDLGTSFKPSGGSIGDWLRSNVTKTKIVFRWVQSLSTRDMRRGLGKLGSRYFESSRTMDSRGELR